MIDLQDKHILINGSPCLVISGEIHYFRLPVDAWEDRIVKLKEAGGNTVASYIPWLCHELDSGEIDLDGHSRAELDLGRFIDLCAAHGMFFFARPGPFIMAEMKNEGIPYRLYENHPGLIPVGWDGAPTSTRTLDYLAPAFLAAVRGWYGHVIPVIAERLHPSGGNVIALQLDNEVGMLSWVSNSPDLTDHVVAGFRDWLIQREGAAVMEQRYGIPAGNHAMFVEMVRSPGEPVAGQLMRDLGRHMRYRFARYIFELRRYAEEFGISGIPYIVNIHGTERGAGGSFPIGISQLYESYTQAPGYLAGSDHYLGDLTGANAPDLYLMNAFMEAVNRPEQPLASVEFEAGEGDYGSSLTTRLDPSAADFKLRMSIAQGNRLINYYLFTGGFNYRLDRETGDGNDRISFTGERHGINAPIDPEGNVNYTLPRLARTNRMLSSLAEHVAASIEDRDNLAVGFIPDYWMTESIYRGNRIMPEIAANLEHHRFGGPGKALIRALLHLTFRYRAVNIQDNSLDVDSLPVLALAPARYMDAGLQHRIVEWLESGGRLLLHGEVPRFDMTGAPCTTLMDTLGLRYLGERTADHRYFLSVTAEGWAAPRPELRAGFAQSFEPRDQGTLFRVYGANEACAFDIAVGKGRAVVVTAEIPTDLDFFGNALARLGVTPGLTHDHPMNGIFMTSTTSPGGARFIHALNLDGVDKHIRIRENGQLLFDGRTVTLPRRDGVMLPLDLPFDGGRVAWSTVEVLACRPDRVDVRLTGDQDTVCLETDRNIAPSPGYHAVRQDGRTLVTSRLRGMGEDVMSITWQP